MKFLTLFLILDYIDSYRAPTDLPGLS